MEKAQIDKMLAMRREGLSYGKISKAFGQKYPAWSRWYILKAAPELQQEIPEATRPIANGGKPRQVPTREQSFDMDVPYTHGDGKVYGCGKVIVTTRLLDPQATMKGKIAMMKHKTTCKKGEKST